MKRSRSLYSYAKDILEDIGYKGYNVKVFFLIILTVLIRTPFDSDFKTALDVLIDKDLVYRTPMGYIIYDHFLSIWLTRQ